MGYLSLIRDYLSLPLSQRRFIAERYGVAKCDPMEPDIERDKRTIKAVADQHKQDEFAQLVEMAKSR